MKSFLKNFPSFLLIAFFIALFLFGKNVLAADGILSKFPYKINFTEAEIKLLKSLDEETLQKLITIAENILKKNKEGGQSSQNASNQPTSQNTQTTNNPNQTTLQNPYLPNNSQQTAQPILQQPISQNISSPIPTVQTPYFNPSTGMYQSSVPSQGSILSNILGGRVSPGLETFSSEPRGLINAENLTNAFPEGIKGDCAQSYGMIVKGRCPKPESWEKLIDQVKIDTTKLCNLTGQRLVVNNAYRNPSCNSAVGGAPKSEHVQGTALDLNLTGSYKNTEERVIVYLYFIAHGYNGLGTYSSGEPHHVDRRSYVAHWGPGQTGCNDAAQTEIIKQAFKLMGLSSFCGSRNESPASMMQKAKNALKAMGKEKFTE